MDNRNQIIDKIELYYQAYLNRQSDVLLNTATNMLLAQIMNMPCCKSIIDDVKRKYPIADDVLRDNQTKEYFRYIDDITKNEEYFFSYCLHWLAYIKENNVVRSPHGYDQKCAWLFSNIRGSKDSMSLFKTDFIRPILDYIILQLRNEAYILYLLDRYKQRIERFGVIQDIVNKKELELQKELHLYLFDQGVELYNSVNIGRGEVDFIVKCNETPFIIEVKIYRSQSCGYLSQLKKYMKQFPALHGCLYIFTTEDVVFELKDSEESIYVKTVYVGKKTPCRGRTDIIKIS